MAMCGTSVGTSDKLPTAGTSRAGCPRRTRACATRVTRAQWAAQRTSSAQWTSQRTLQLQLDRCARAGPRPARRPIRRPPPSLGERRCHGPR
eukprot:scaffold29004_cov62-Phaeocystis_antarctica.AAC.2